MPKLSIQGVPWNVFDRGDGPVLLLIHGFPLDHSMWRGQFALANRYRLLIPDLPGFGESQLGEQTLSMSQTADDLVSLLDGMSVTTPIACCGLSMGGYVGWQLWKRHRDRLRCLIQCDTRALADSSEVARGRQIMAQNVVVDGSATVAAALVPKLFSPATLDHRPDLVEGVRFGIASTDPRAIAAAQLGMADREDFSKQLADIDLPTLFICGESDVISPPAEMRGLAQSVPNARYVEVASAGHMSPLENPHSVNQAIDEFLQSIR